MAIEASPSPHVEHECVGAAVLAEFSLALRTACFLCASAVCRQSLKRFFCPPNGMLARTEFSIKNLLWQSAATYSLALSFGTIAKWRPVVNGQKVAINHIKL